MNGASAPTEGLTHIEKWALLNKTMINERIAILAVQETHLNNDILQDVVTCFGKNLEIIASADPVRPTSSAGVAFVMNKTLIRPQECRAFELIPGRALMLKIKWLESCSMTITNIYAPNQKTEHPNFWATIEMERRNRHLPRPDFSLGDFNITEELIDRIPPREADGAALEALRDIRDAWGVVDMWRHLNPNKKEYTYRARSDDQQIKSRLDRIYVSNKIAKTTFDWQIKPSAVPTDHWLVRVKYAPKDAPLIGSGRWTWPLHQLQNKKLLDLVEARGAQLLADLDRHRIERTDRQVENPQTLWKKFKDDIVVIAKKITAASYHKIHSRSKAIEKDLQTTRSDPDFDTNDELRTHEAFLASELAHLERVKAKNQRKLTRARLSNHGEKLGGCWSALSKDSKPRDIIYRLKIPQTNPTQYERCSKRMAEMARNYHENLQENDSTPPINQEERALTMEQVLNEIPITQRMEEPDQSPLNWQLSEEHVNNALKLVKEGTATGLDGCPNELWKVLKSRHDSAQGTHKTSFNITKALTSLFRDIQTHGVDPRTDFAMGWMCPLFKKKDPTDISNYRPITVLNTDYKLLTKVLGLQLIDPANNMIHEDQAGFMPGRSIFNHIRLAKAIISYADIAEENGAIVALDQEKAYDRIRHDYLWEVLKAFRIPQPFINVVKALYQNASTRVAINGVLSSPFKVTRGVRQGDPLSCPLFDLAIEPLACMLRNNPEIHGLRIPGLIEKLIVKLFADDTNLYLSNKDRLDLIQEILDRWCKASGAKFNIEKTEIIPIGSVQFRRSVTETRKINAHDRQPIPNHIRIAEDGEAIRMLGAWIGNNVENLTTWEHIIDKVNHNLNRWEKTHPTLNGRRIITQAVIGGLTQFLTQAQGMPQRIESALDKIITSFIWEEGSARIAAKTLHRPTEEGGLGLLNLKSRNEAIELMWLRAYLNFSKKRQPWAIVTDLIVDATAPANTIKRARKNPFLQSWNAPLQGRKAERLTDDIKRMLNIAKKYGTNLAAIRLTPHLRAQLPAFYHLLTEHRSTNNRQSKCLINTHKADTVADLVKIAARLDLNREPPHRNSPFCDCAPCKTDQDKGCYNPHECATEARLRVQQIPPKLNPKAQGEQHDNLSLTQTRKMRNIIAKQNNQKVTFDPSFTCKENLAECFRVFVDPTHLSNDTAQRNRTRGRNPTCQECTVYTDGACLNNGKRNAKCGSGIWFGHNNQHNAALRIPGESQSNQVGELAAVIAAISKVPNSQPLVIVTDSKYVIEGLTTHLEAWENAGWIGIKNAPLFKKAVTLLRQRSATTAFKWTKGHDGDEGNEQSDRLAKEGARKHTFDPLELDIPDKFNIQGAKLSTLTQALAYKGIQDRKIKPTRLSTDRNLTLTREAVRRHTREEETDATIWSGLRRATLRPRVKQFLYKAMHEAYKIGAFWANIPNYEHRQICQLCGTIESLDHILTSCESRPRQIIWNLAKQAWPHNEQQWPEIAIGSILGVGCLKIKRAQTRQRDQVDKTDRGATRLLHILISESAHLIWVLRCERVIGDTSHNDSEIRSRWLKMINARLTEDRVTATKIKRTRGFTELVVNTWEQVLKKEGDTPNDWIHRSEVLVGSRPRVLHHGVHVL
jgi:ribonuclease HI/exonuclease III